MIDINRLHDVITGKISGRNCGKTYAICCAIAGLMEFHSDERITVLINNYEDIHSFACQLAEVFHEHELSLQQRSSIDFECITTGTVLRFRSRFEVIPILEMQMRRFEDTVLIDARRDIHPGRDNYLYLRD